MALEELDGALVPLRGSERLERAEVLALARARVLLARVEAERAGLELPDHASKLRMQWDERTVGYYVVQRIGGVRGANAWLVTTG